MWHCPWAGCDSLQLLLDARPDVAGDQRRHLPLQRAVFALVHMLCPYRPGCAAYSSGATATTARPPGPPCLRHSAGR